MISVATVQSMYSTANMIQGLKSENIATIEVATISASPLFATAALIPNDAAIVINTVRSNERRAADTRMQPVSTRSIAGDAGCHQSAHGSRAHQRHHCQRNHEGQRRHLVVRSLRFLDPGHQIKVALICPGSTKTFGGFNHQGVAGPQHNIAQLPVQARATPMHRDHSGVIAAPELRVAQVAADQRRVV